MLHVVAREDRRQHVVEHGAVAHAQLLAAVFGHLDQVLAAQDAHRRCQVPSPDEPRLNGPSLAWYRPMGELVGWSLPTATGTSPSFR